MRLLIIVGVAILTQCSRPQNMQDCKADMNESETYTHETSCSSPFDIGKDEVRDTSFTLPRGLLNNPEVFMKALTDVQTINRECNNGYNYTEKLMLGDSILGEICKDVADGNGKPLFLIDEMSICESQNYFLNVKKAGERVYTSYKPKKSGVEMAVGKISEFYSNLLDEWNKEDMFLIGETDEPKGIVTSTGRTIHLGKMSGKDSGCITRLRCDNDTVYVDMIKLYLSPFRLIMDEAEEKKLEEQRLLLKQARESEK